MTTINNTKYFCSLAKQLAYTEAKLKSVVRTLVKKSMPDGYELQSVIEIDSISVTYRAELCNKRNPGKRMLCDFKYKDGKLEICASCLNMFNQYYVYPDRPYALKCSNATETFPYDEEKLTETLKIFDTLESLCPPKVLLADKNDQNWPKTAFNPRTP